MIVAAILLRFQHLFRSQEIGATRLTKVEGGLVVVSRLIEAAIVNLVDLLARNPFGALLPNRLLDQVLGRRLFPEITIIVQQLRRAFLQKLLLAESMRQWGLRFLF